jgi:hypothetical protein
MSVSRDVRSFQSGTSLASEATAASVTVTPTNACCAWSASRATRLRVSCSALRAACSALCLELTAKNAKNAMLRPAASATRIHLNRE